jgi:hypothetical protein
MIAEATTRHQYLYLKDGAGRVKVIFCSTFFNLNADCKIGLIPEVTPLDLDHVQDNIEPVREILERPSFLLSEDYTNFKAEQVESRASYWIEKTEREKEKHNLRMKHLEEKAAFEKEKHETEMKHLDEKCKDLKKKIEERKEVFELKRKYWEQKDLAMRRKYWRTVIEKDNIKQNVEDSNKAGA